MNSGAAGMMTFAVFAPLVVFPSVPWIAAADSSLPLRYFDTHARGDVLSRVTNDIDNVAQSLQQTLSQLVMSVMTVLGILVMMLWISPLLALIAVIYYGVAAPLFAQYQAARQSTTQLHMALERYQRLGRTLAPRQAELVALKQEQAAEQGFLEGASETLLAAQIQNRIKTLVEQVHGELQSTQALPTETEGKLRRIVVRARMQVTLPGAQQVFYGLESDSPLLFLDNLDMRAHVAERRRDRGAPGSDDSMLDLRFDVYGYVRGAKAEKQSVAIRDPLAAATR